MSTKELIDSIRRAHELCICGSHQGVEEMLDRCLILAKDIAIDYETIKSSRDAALAKVLSIESES